MAVIEKHLHEHFASLEDADERPIPSQSDQEPALRDSASETLDVPFARVNSVVAGSPADTAGLKAGDLIRNFGYVDRSNHDNLKKVGECVQGNEGVRCLSHLKNVPLYFGNEQWLGSGLFRHHNRRFVSDLDSLLTPKQQNILVKVSRDAGSGRQQELRLTLTPRRNWGGRGLLGCHILPL